MKKMVLLILAGAVFFAGCANRVPVAKFSGIYPGMTCQELDAYLKNQKVPFKKDGGAYRFVLEGDVWEDAAVNCDKIITGMKFGSEVGTTPKYAQNYIDTQDALLRAFRDNLITYEEGSRVINLNDGIKLHQFADAKAGIITRFAISVDNVEGSKGAWKKASEILPKIGASK